MAKLKRKIARKIVRRRKASVKREAFEEAFERAELIARGERLEALEREMSRIRGIIKIWTPVVDMTPSNIGPVVDALARRVVILEEVGQEDGGPSASNAWFRGYQEGIKTERAKTAKRK